MLGDFESINKKQELCIRGSVVGFTVVYLQTNANPKTLIRAACVVSRKSKSGFPNQKTDHESIKSTLRVDSWNQIQIRSFEIDNLSVFWERIWKKLFLTGGFAKKKVPNSCCTCMAFLLNLCWWHLINFEPLVTYHSMYSWRYQSSYYTILFQTPTQIFLL